MNYSDFEEFCRERNISENTIYSVNFMDFKNYALELHTRVNVDNHNSDSYDDIYKFILNNVIPQYDILYSCDFLHEDELGNLAIEFYIKYNGYLSFDERNILNYKILEDIYNFCVDSDFAQDFENLSIFLVQM